MENPYSNLKGMENRPMPELNSTIEVPGKIISGQRIETPLEFLDRLLLNHEIYAAGLESYIEFRDQFIGLSLSEQPEKNVNNFIEHRPRFLRELESIRKDIENLKLEIEVEKAAPSNEPMLFRLMKRLGHI